jgi:hypothetical protein
MQQNKAWFQQRIGKRVWMQGFDCDCKICKEYREDGMVVQEPEYFADLVADFAVDGNKLVFFDSKQERDEYGK